MMTGVFPSAVAAWYTLSANGQLVSCPAYTPLPQLVNPDPGANAAGAGVVAAGAAGADDAGAECVPTAGLLAAAGEDELVLQAASASTRAAPDTQPMMVFLISDTPMGGKDAVPVPGEPEGRRE